MHQEDFKKYMLEPPTWGEVRINGVLHAHVSTPVCNQVVQVANLRARLFLSLLSFVSSFWDCAATDSSLQTPAVSPRAQTIAATRSRLISPRRVMRRAFRRVIAQLPFCHPHPSRTMQEVVRRQNYSREQVSLCRVDRMPPKGTLSSLCTNGDAQRRTFQTFSNLSR